MNHKLAQPNKIISEQLDEQLDKHLDEHAWLYARALLLRRVLVRLIHDLLGHGQLLLDDLAANIAQS